MNYYLQAINQKKAAVENLREQAANDNQRIEELSNIIKSYETLTLELIPELEAEIAYIENLPIRLRKARKNRIILWAVMIVISLILLLVMGMPFEIITVGKAICASAVFILSIHGGSDLSIIKKSMKKEKKNPRNTSEKLEEAQNKAKGIVKKYEEAKSEKLALEVAVEGTETTIAKLEDDITFSEEQLEQTIKQVMAEAGISLESLLNERYIAAFGPAILPPTLVNIE